MDDASSDFCHSLMLPLAGSCWMAFLSPDCFPVCRIMDAQRIFSEIAIREQQEQQVAYVSGTIITINHHYQSTVKIHAASRERMQTCIHPLACSFQATYAQYLQAVEDHMHLSSNRGTVCMLYRTCELTKASMVRGNTTTECKAQSAML